MPELHWNGKEAVMNHHHTVPIRALLIDEGESFAHDEAKAQGWEPSLDDNLIITGDNLEALKALLPKYAGKVDVIYIDPPYNTDNETWVYNDNVNSPQIKAWLGKIVGQDDLERHDKWLCMMYPRIALLKNLLEEAGVLFLSIGDEEQSSLKLLLDEIFGRDNKIGEFSITRAEGGGMAKHIVKGHDYLFAYCKNINNYNLLRRDKEIRGKIVNVDEVDFVIETDWLRKEFGKYGNCHFEEVLECFGENRLREIEEGLVSGLYRLIPQKSGLNIIGRLKKLDGQSSKLHSVHKFLTKKGKEALADLGLEGLFDYPKPPELVNFFIKSASFHNKNALILDSFAGSGTTGQAVLELNAEDGGNRKFILVQMAEDTNDNAKEKGYTTVDAITRKRIELIIKGVKTAKSKELQEGFGGSFTSVTLGNKLHLDALATATDEELPSYEQLAAYVFYHTTLQALPKQATTSRNGFIGETATNRVYLLYKPSQAALTTSECAFTLSIAESIQSELATTSKEAIVYAPLSFVDAKTLRDRKWRIRYCNLPYELLQVDPIKAAPEYD
jgi:adenine-specific DNA-methyltransferase